MDIKLCTGTYLRNLLLLRCCATPSIIAPVKSPWLEGSSAVLCICDSVKSTSSKWEWNLQSVMLALLNLVPLITYWRSLSKEHWSSVDSVKSVLNNWAEYGVVSKKWENSHSWRVFLINLVYCKKVSLNVLDTCMQFRKCTFCTNVWVKLQCDITHFNGILPEENMLL